DEAVYASVGKCDRQREAATHWPRPGQRVVSLAVSRARHRLLVETIGGAQAGRKQRVADLDAEVCRVAAPPAQFDGKRIQVEQLDAAILAGHQRVVLVAEAGIDRELLIHLPAIRDVDGILVLASA